VPAPTVRARCRSVDSAAPASNAGGAAGTTARLRVAGTQTMTSPIPPSGRADARPVRRRTRTFRPHHLSFARTYQCTHSLHYYTPVATIQVSPLFVHLEFRSARSESQRP